MRRCVRGSSSMTAGAVIAAPKVMPNSGLLRMKKILKMRCRMKAKVMIFILPWCLM